MIDPTKAHHVTTSGEEEVLRESSCNFLPNVCKVCTRPSVFPSNTYEMMKTTLSFFTMEGAKSGAIVTGLLGALALVSIHVSTLTALAALSHGTLMGPLLAIGLFTVSAAFTLGESLGDVTGTMAGALIGGAIGLVVCLLMTPSMGIEYGMNCYTAYISPKEPPIQEAQPTADPVE